MTLDQNKALVRRFVDEVFVAGRMDSVDGLVAPDFVPHSWPGTDPGPAELKRAMSRVFAGLSDVSMQIEEMIAEGDLVAIRLTAHAVQTGEFMGMPPSGKAYTIPEIHIFRVRDGIIAGALGPGGPARHDAPAGSDARPGLDTGPWRGALTPGRPLRAG